MKNFSKRLMTYLKTVHGSHQKAKEWLENTSSNFTFQKFSEMNEKDILNELSLGGHSIY